MSPRKAFSLAMSGGLKVLCALAKWVMAMGDIFSGGVEETADLALLRMAPMLGFFLLLSMVQWRGRINTTEIKLTFIQTIKKRYGSNKLQVPGTCSRVYAEGVGGEIATKASRQMRASSYIRRTIGISATVPSQGAHDLSPNR